MFVLNGCNNFPFRTLTKCNFFVQLRNEEWTLNTKVITQIGNVPLPVNYRLCNDQRWISFLLYVLNIWVCVWVQNFRWMLAPAALFVCAVCRKTKLFFLVLSINGCFFSLLLCAPQTCKLFSLAHNCLFHIAYFLFHISFSLFFSFSLSRLSMF